MVLGFVLEYFEEAGVSHIDNVTYKADTLVLSCSEFDSISTNPVFRFSFGVLFDSKNSFNIDDKIDVSGVTYQYRLFFDKIVGFQITLDYPHYLLIEPSAFSYLASFLKEGGNTGGTSDSLLTSLNGNFGTFPDGALVTVQGLLDTYQVQSSFLGFDNPQTGGLIPTYLLINSANKVIECPHVLLSLQKENN